MRATVTVLGLATLAALSVPADAQQYPYSGPQNIYIDGSTPVDPLIQREVDAYMIQQEQRELDKAERLEELQLHMYQDRASTVYAPGRF